MSGAAVLLRPLRTRILGMLAEPQSAAGIARTLDVARQKVGYHLKELEKEGRTRPVAIVFGTGWGVHESFYPAVDRILTPIYGPEGKEGYNHLSVRSAVAIILDRLLGQ